MAMPALLRIGLRTLPVRRPNLAPPDVELVVSNCALVILTRELEQETQVLLHRVDGDAPRQDRASRRPRQR